MSNSKEVMQVDLRRLLSNLSEIDLDGVHLALLSVETNVNDLANNLSTVFSTMFARIPSALSKKWSHLNATGLQSILRISN